MSTAFDPYHRWLGIPPEEQPPNYYRLLGIAVFEPNADVIEAAADRQMAFLRTFQAGPRAKASQQLLNEVAAARVCLLNPAKRGLYDAQLRQQCETATPPSPSENIETRGGIFAPQVRGAIANEPLAAVPGRLSQPLPVHEPPPAPGPQLSARSVRRRKRRLPMVLGLLAAGSFLLLAVTFLLSFHASGEVILDWPPGERNGGKLSINGRPFHVPDRGQLRLPLPPGDYFIVAERPGMEPFRHSLSLAAGQRVSVAPKWAAARDLVETPMTSVVPTLGSDGPPPPDMDDTSPPFHRLVDLAPRVDLTCDVARGDWRLVAGQLTVRAQRPAQLMLPVAIKRGNYDLVLEVTVDAEETPTRASPQESAESQSESGAIAVVLPIEDRRCAVLLSTTPGECSGIELVAGRWVRDEGNRTRVSRGLWERGQAYQVIIGVRSASDAVSLALSVNGDSWIAEKAKPSELLIAPGWATPQPLRPALGVRAAHVTFHKIALRQINGSVSWAK